MMENNPRSDDRSRAAVKFCSCVTAAIILFPVSATCAGFEIDCNATLAAYRTDPRMKNYNCTCDPNDNSRRPECNPKNAAGERSSGGRKMSANSQMRMQVVETVLGAMLQNAFAAPKESKESNNEQIRLQQDMARAAEEQARQKAMQHWRQMQSDAEAKGKLDQEGKADQGNRLLSKMQPLGGGNRIEPFRTGNAALDLKPVGQSTYPPLPTQLERLTCSGYFSSLAKKAASDVDMRFYADQAQRALSGQPTHLECRIPPARSEDLSKLMEEVQAVFVRMNEVNGRILDFEERIAEKREKITAKEAEKEKLTATIGDLQARATTAKPEEKDGIDDLLRQAQEQAADLDRQILDEKRAETDLQKEIETAEKEFDSIRTQATNVDQDGSSGK